MLIEFCKLKGILSKKQADDISNEANLVFKHLSFSDDQTESTLESKSVSLFIDYVRDIFIFNKIKPDYLHRDQVDRNSKVPCYCLEYDFYYTHFAQTYSSHQILEHEEFEYALKSLGIIMTYKDRGQIYMPRKYGGKDYNMLVVIQEAIHEPDISDI